MIRILVVDDERSMQEFLEILLRRDGFDVVAVSSAPEALLALETDEFDLVISDIRMPGMSGLELLGRVKDLCPETLVILITAHGSTESAVEAMKHGAYDYLTKPCRVDEIRLVVEKALEKKNLSNENRILRRQLQNQIAFPTIVGKSSAMQEVFDLIRQVAPTRANIFISGESGTGKELAARAIHSASERRERPFVTVSCAAIPENLLESELFGHVKGAFTGAVVRKEGLFEVAHGGTLFLDEIGEMPSSLQVKLLRAIQDKSFKPVGGTEETQVDVRIICATNRELSSEVRAGRFREDLFYRLNVIEIHLPALRDRREDLPLLIQHFMQKYSQELNRDVLLLDRAALDALDRHRFPGNVRELENLIERAVTLSTGPRVTLDCLPPLLLEEPGVAAAEAVPTEGVDLDKLLATYERTLLLGALKRGGRVKKRAAALLGITFRSFRYRYEKLGLDDPDDPAS